MTHKSSWVSVSDDLPASSRLVLVAYNGMWKPGRRKHWTVLMAKYSGGKWRFVSDKDKSRRAERVRFWMHMPKAPRGNDASAE